MGEVIKGISCKGSTKGKKSFKIVEKSRTSFFAMVISNKLLRCSFITEQLPVNFLSFSSGIVDSTDRASCGKIQQAVCIPVTGGLSGTIEHQTKLLLTGHTV